MDKQGLFILASADMRLWSIHPKYLDPKGLVALWRETLLAQKVLAGNTKGYKNHPQLLRFREQKDPLRFIGAYLFHVQLEAEKRGYSFDRTKILKIPAKNWKIKIAVNGGQRDFEFVHLKKKLKARAPSFYQKSKTIKKPGLHPLFRGVAGGVEDWEVIQA
ncbi:MAG: pyrimidine dimer DNA glycosylase/endonuclease V [Bdellovibrionota bacterium]